jgi:hypothetical protein
MRTFLFKLTNPARCSMPLAAALVLALTCAADARAHAASPAQSAAPVQFALGGNVSQIPIEVTGNLVFVAAGVNDAQPSWFLLDTTEPTSAFDDIRAASQNLLPRSTTGAKVTALQNAVLDFPGLKVTVPSLTLSSLDDISSRVGRAVQGILGADVLSHFVVVLDYERPMLQLYDPKSYHYPGKSDKLKWTVADGVPAISARVEIRGKGRFDTLFRIATAQPEPIVFSPSFASSHDFASLMSKAIPFASASDASKAEGKLGRVQTLAIGKTVLQDPLAVFPTSSAQSSSSSAEIAGSMGAGILNRFTLVLDYSNQVSYFTPNPRVMDLFTADMSGLGLVAIPPDYRSYEVAQVLDGSPAAEAGFAVGDILVSIDGNPASDSSLDDVRSLLRQEDSTHQITVERGGKTLDFTIKLKRLV